MAGPLPGNAQMLALGAYRFAVTQASYQSLARVDEYRWARGERLGASVALQYLGQGAKTITLEGLIYPHWRGGLGQVEAMRQEAGQGEPLLLVDGLGHLWGKWAILRISERQSDFFADGAPRLQRFTLELEQDGGA